MVEHRASQGACRSQPSHSLCVSPELSAFPPHRPLSPCLPVPASGEKCRPWSRVGQSRKSFRKTCQRGTNRGRMVPAGGTPRAHRQVLPHAIRQETTAGGVALTGLEGERAGNPLSELHTFLSLPSSQPFNMTVQEGLGKPRAPEAHPGGISLPTTCDFLLTALSSCER